jgi:hypothetical protein
VNFWKITVSPSPLRYTILSGSVFDAFHPEITFAEDKSGRALFGIIGQYQSALALWAFRQGLSVAQTEKLFRRDVFQPRSVISIIGITQSIGCATWIGL